MLDLAMTSQTVGSTTRSREAANSSRMEAARATTTGSVHRRNARGRVCENENCNSKVSTRVQCFSAFEITVCTTKQCRWHQMTFIESFFAVLARMQHLYTCINAKKPICSFD